MRSFLRVLAAMLTLASAAHAGAGQAMGTSTSRSAGTPVRLLAPVVFDAGTAQETFADAGAMLDTRSASADSGMEAATPLSVPEPESYMLLLAGLLIVVHVSMRMTRRNDR